MFACQLRVMEMKVVTTEAGTIHPCRVKDVFVWHGVMCVHRLCWCSGTRCVSTVLTSSSWLCPMHMSPRTLPSITSCKCRAAPLFNMNVYNFTLKIQIWTQNKLLKVFKFVINIIIMYAYIYIYIGISYILEEYENICAHCSATLQYVIILVALALCYTRCKTIPFTTKNFKID